MECLRAAWETKTQTPIQKLVLVRLADRANGDNACWPGVSSIARECCLSESSVHRALKALVAAGAIKTERGGGAKPNTYVLATTPVTQTPLADRHPCHTDTGGVPDRQGTGATQTPEGCHTDTQTLTNPKEPPSNPHPPRASVSRRPASVQEVIEKGKFIGLDEQSCRDWFRDCEACGWTRGDGSPFDNWPRQLVIHREHIAEKRIKGNGQASGRPATIMDLKAIIQVKEEKAKALRDKFSTDGPLSVDWRDQTKRQEWSALRTEIKGLKERIEKMA